MSGLLYDSQTSLIHWGMQQDHIIRLALERLKAITVESQELEVFIATYQKLAGRLPSVEPVAPVLKRQPDTPPVSDKPWSTERILLAAGEALNANKGPMKLGALFAELVRRGVVIGGGKPVNNLGAKLSADKVRFETSEHGWWYRGEPLPLEYRKDFEDSEIEKGPEAFDPEPSRMNGAAKDHTAANGH